MFQGLPAPVCVPVQLCPLHQRRLSIVRVLSKRDNEATRTETEDRVSKRGCLTLMLEIIWCANPGEICLFPLVTLVHFTQLIWPQMCYGHSTTLVITTTTATSFTTDLFSTPKAHQKCFNTVKSSQIIFLVSFCTLWNMEARFRH